MNHPENIIYNRKLILCPTIVTWSVPELLRECPGCNDFLLYCYCHNFRIIFTDGACTNNGRPGAKAGIGVAYGNCDESQLSEPITDMVDNFPLRSNQRAELCAAKLGVEFLSEATTQHSEHEAVAWIIATDSEYVVKGMIEWLPTWKRNGWRTSKGTKPANLDLFVALDDAVTTLEAKNVMLDRLLAYSKGA